MPKWLENMLVRWGKSWLRKHWRTTVVSLVGIIAGRFTTDPELQRAISEGTLALVALLAGDAATASKSEPAPEIAQQQTRVKAAPEPEPEEQYPQPQEVADIPQDQGQGG